MADNTSAYECLILPSGADGVACGCSSCRRTVSQNTVAAFNQASITRQESFAETSTIIIYNAIWSAANDRGFTLHLIHDTPIRLISNSTAIYDIIKRIFGAHDNTQRYFELHMRSHVTIDKASLSPLMDMSG